MKKLIFAIVLLPFVLDMQAQVDIGIKAGLNTIDVDGASLFVEDESTMTDHTFSVKDAEYGYHFGLFLRAKLAGIYIQPEVLFNSDRVNYTFKDNDDNNIANSVLTETYHNIDVPVLLGLKLGPLKFNAGPVGHFHLNAASDLVDEEYYESEFNNFDLGWQAGVGLEIWKLVFDIRYEGNFNKFGDHLNLFNQDVAFSKNENRMLASVGFKF